MQPELVLMVVDISLLGAALGAFTGITPGVHVNTLAMGVLIAFPVLDGALGPFLSAAGVDPGLSPLLLACLLVSASVVHSFLDFIPSVFFGAPEESESLSVLPGHRLLLSGRGMDAIVSAANGSLVGAMAAVVVSVPVMVALQYYPGIVDNVDPYVPGLLLCAAALIIMSQGEVRDAAWEISVESISIGKDLVIGHAVPVDGAEVTLSGRTARAGLLGRAIVIDDVAWRLRGRHPVPVMFVTVHGTWRMRRRRWRKKALALMSFVLSGAIGLAVMDGRPPGASLFEGFDGNLLFPMLTGLFAVPALIESSSGGKVPEQELEPDASADIPSSIKGVGAGLFAAWVPGVTSTAGTVLGGMLGRRDDEDPNISAERFITMSASVGTAATVFGIAAMAATGGGGTGVLIAVGDIIEASDLPTDPGAGLAMASLFLLSALAASLLGYVLTIRCGKALARRVSRSDPARSSKAILAFEVVLVLVLTGAPGLIILAISTLVGSLPPAVGVSRVCLTGCLAVPLLLSYFGMDLVLASFLGGA